MPRPRPGYTRPEMVECAYCRGPVEVAGVGRIPDAHPACAELGRAQRRVIAALVEAVAGRSPAELRALRRAWASTQSEANVVWNRVDNPAKRGRSDG